MPRLNIEVTELMRMQIGAICNNRLPRQTIREFSVDALKSEIARKKAWITKTAVKENSSK